LRPLADCKILGMSIDQVALYSSEAGTDGQDSDYDSKDLLPRLARVAPQTLAAASRASFARNAEPTIPASEPLGEVRRAGQEGVPMGGLDILLQTSGGEQRRDDVPIEDDEEIVLTD
jgi:hypothetical protein